MRYSHLSRLEEKKARQKIKKSAFLLFIFVMLLYFGGVPFFTRISLLLAGPSSKSQSGDTSSTILLPPRLEPVDEATMSSTINVSGFANEGVKVQLTVNGDDSDSTTIGKDGRFEFKDVTLHEGENTISARSEIGKQASLSSDPIVITYKSKPPILDLAQPEDGRNYYGDDRNAIFSGKTEPGSKVSINDRLVIVNSDGTFTYTNQLSEGENHFKIVAQDIAGNETYLERKVTYKP